MKEIAVLFGLGVLVSAVMYVLAPFVFPYVFVKYDVSLLFLLFSFILLILPFRYFSTFLGVGYIGPGGFAYITTVTLLGFGLVNVLLDLWFLQLFGYIGVIYATVLSQFGYIFSNFVWFYLVLRKK